MGPLHTCQAQHAQQGAVQPQLGQPMPPEAPAAAQVQHLQGNNTHTVFWGGFEQTLEGGKYWKMASKVTNFWYIKQTRACGLAKTMYMRLEVLRPLPLRCSSNRATTGVAWCLPDGSKQGNRQRLRPIQMQGYVRFDTALQGFLQLRISGKGILGARCCQPTDCRSPACKSRAVHTKSQVCALHSAWGYIFVGILSHCNKKEKHVKLGQKRTRGPSTQSHLQRSWQWLSKSGIRKCGTAL